MSDRTCLFVRLNFEFYVFEGCHGGDMGVSYTRILFEREELWMRELEFFHRATKLFLEVI